MKYRIGLDMGATSIGWSAFDIDNQKLLDFGVRIFDDGRDDKSKASLCVKRRSARGARRLVNRRHIKTQELLKTLTNLHLFPTDKAEKEALKKMNPYELRQNALDRVLLPYEFGRVLLQLSKRKGFLSNRKDDKAEGGKLKSGYQELLDAMAEKGARTYGEFLVMRQKANQTIRLKNLFDASGKYLGGLFPFREVYIKEFNTIWERQKALLQESDNATESQRAFYADILTDENRDKLKNIMFFQRPLKEADEGECLFEKGEKRIPRAHPLFQEFRIWQNVMNLTFSAETETDYHGLSKEQTVSLIELLNNPVSIKPTTKGIVAYGNIKKALGLDKKGLFNFERKEESDSGLDKGLLVNTTQHAVNQSKFLLPYWEKMTQEQRGKLINVLARPHIYIEYPRTKISIEDENQLILNYLVKEFNLSAEAANEVFSEINFEPDFGSLSEKAIRKILGLMKEGMMYVDAWQELYPAENKEHLDTLPYYGVILSQSCLGKKENPQTPEEKYGKINNATVHVALNQVRHLINEMISRYGKPYDIAVEYARDLPASAKERLKMTDTRNANTQENQRIEAELKAKCGDRPYTKHDITKYKIWKRLGVLSKEPLTKECPFTGRPISVSDLMDGQKVQIEHLIPFSRSLDDSLDNKVLAYVDANRFKGNRTPYEAFGKSPDGYPWADIMKRAKRLPAGQQWRFAPDAMQKFEQQAGPIARSLNDTRYMTRLLHDYLQPIVREDGKQTVQAVVGALTALIRKAWGLNIYKDESDMPAYREFHNHHAIDAIIVSVIERGQIANVSKLLQNVKTSVREEFKNELPKFRDPAVSAEEKKDLKKRIKDFETVRTIALVNEYFKLPENLKVNELINQVKQINISHKPNLKDITAPNSTIGQLHEDSAYGLQHFVNPNEGLTAVFKFQDKTMEKGVNEYIPMFYDKADKKAYYDAYKAWYILDRKASTMKATDKEQKLQKQQIAEQEKQAVQNLREKSEKAFKWFIGGGNFCADVYEINPQNKINGVPTNDRGEWKTEIVSNYNATIRQSRGEDIAYWRYKYPNAKRIMRLRRNDMVLATFTKEQAFAEKFPKGIAEYVRDKFNQNPLIETVDVLFRVKKMSDGAIYLTPHNIAKEDGDTKSWKASAGSLKTYRARKVYVSPMGRIYNAKQTY